MIRKPAFGAPVAAGRALSRTAARKSKTSQDVYSEMEALGVVFRASDPKGVAEEAAIGYKDIESVMAASASSVRPGRSDRRSRRAGAYGQHQAICGLEDARTFV